LICLSGTVEVTVGDERFSPSERDSIYVPRDLSIPFADEVFSGQAEFSGKIEGNYPPEARPLRGHQGRQSLHFTAGGPATTRDLYIVIGENVRAGWLLAGLTIFRARQLDELASAGEQCDAGGVVEASRR